MINSGFDRSTEKDYALVGYLTALALNLLGHVEAGIWTRLLIYLANNRTYQSDLLILNILKALECSGYLEGHCHSSVTKTDEWMAYQRRINGHSWAD